MSSEYEVGLKVRRSVLGDEYVDQVLRETTDLSRDFQTLLTKYCWGSVWARRGLSRRDRSLINIAMLVALNRPHELRLHIKGAIRNGCSEAEISEVLLQTAIYCGIPAAATGYSIAAEVIRELSTEGNGANTGERAAAPRAKHARLTKTQPRSLTYTERRDDGNGHQDGGTGHTRSRSLRRKPAVR